MWFQAVVWEHDGGYILARIPALGIEVITTTRDDLDAVLRRDSLNALRRLNWTTGLKSLSGLQGSAVRLEWVSVEVVVPSLKERATRKDDGEGGKKSVWKAVTSPIAADRLPPAFEVDEAVTRMVESLGGNQPQSVLLVGPSGVGKTAAFGELVRRAAQFHLGDISFVRTSGARIVAGQTGFGMWEERCQDLIREAGEKRAVLHVGSLVELMEVGKSEGNPSGIATFLRPAVARGALLCVAECTPEQLSLIEKEDAQLLDAFRQVRVEEPGPLAGRTILARVASADRRRETTAKALAAVDRLHRRYATYSAYPGRPLRFLDRLRRDGPAGTSISEAEVYPEFGRATGLPQFLIDPAEPLDLEAAREWFAARVVGQEEAVNLVVDLLATVKAGLARPNRPVASLLFVGPTGVGKTEMAKALAEFLFGAADRLTRFDMSEYADPVAVRRLIGGTFGTEGLLTAAVREQPFCVLLLDEVEKADRSAFDLLLQALGEARLTDAGGRLADFRNAVVILTSNLGSESYRAGRPGFAATASTPADATAHFGAAVEKFLRPEMLNRLDRVVPFVSLGPAAIHRIAGREWKKVLSRDGVRFRGLEVKSNDGLLDHVAAVGFDPTYGARPLKRAMERELLAPLATQLNRYPEAVPLRAEVGVSRGLAFVTVQPHAGPVIRTSHEPAKGVAESAQNLRRWHQLLEKATVVRDLENDVYQLGEHEKRILLRRRKGKPIGPSDAEVFARLGRLREVRDLLHRHRSTVIDLEDQTLVAFHSGSNKELSGPVDNATAEWDDLLHRLYALNRTDATSVTLGLFSEHRGNLVQLGEAYRVIARKTGLQALVSAYVTLSAEAAKEETIRFLQTQDPADFPDLFWENDDVLFAKAGAVPLGVLRRIPLRNDAIETLEPGTIGLGIGIVGTTAEVRYSAEAGLHKFPTATDENRNPHVLVSVSANAMAAYCPPVEMVRRGAIPTDPPRRLYDRGEGRVVDYELNEEFTGLWGELDRLLDPALNATVRYRLRQIVLE